MKTKSYVLFVPGRSAPTVFHTEIEPARTEAKRLINIGESQVMICEFIEGFERVVTARPLKKNPLTNKKNEPTF